MYFLYKELQKAVGAKYCCLCHFYDYNSENIITCSSDTITIYQVVKIKDVNAGSSFSYKLKVCDQFSFCGEIQSIACIPLKKIKPSTVLSERDAVILSFKGNYVSFLAYDETEGDLCNIECFDFNKDHVVALNNNGNEIELGDTSFVLNQGLIRVDPDYRCVSILLNHFSFIIIPITVEGLSEHFKVYKSEMSIQGEIKDYCFLYHSVLPTLAILSENIPTWAGTSSYSGSNTSLSLLTITPSIHKYEVIYSYHGLPYDCTCIYSLPSQNQVYFIVSTHLVFYFISNQPFLIILNAYGKQYVQERASFLPNSFFNKPYLQSELSTPCYMENSYVSFNEKDRTGYIVNNHGEIFSIQTEWKDQQIENLQLQKESMILMDVCSVVTLSLDNQPLLFLGSNSSQSILFDVSIKQAIDGTQAQHSINNLQYLQSSPQSHSPSLALTHGYSPLLGSSFPSSNSITEVFAKTPLLFESSFHIQTSSLHQFLQTVYLQSSQLLVLSNSRDTMIYSIQNNNFNLLTQENTPLHLDWVTIAIGAIWTCFGQVIIQVSERSLLVANEKEMICEIHQNELNNTKIRTVSFGKDKVYFCDSNNELRVLRIIEQEPFYQIDTFYQSSTNQVTTCCIWSGSCFDQIQPKQHSLFPDTCYHDHDDIAYSTTSECIKEIQMNSFELQDNEELFTTNEKPSKPIQLNSIEEKEEEYIFFACSDSTIQCYNTTTSTPVFTLSQIHLRLPVLYPCSSMDDFDMTVSKTCCFLSYCYIGPNYCKEMKIPVLIIGFSDGEILVYKQQSKNTPIFTRCDLSISIHPSTMHSAIHPIIDSYYYSGIFFTGDRPCYLTTVSGQPQLIHFTELTDCDSPSLLTVTSYNDVYCAAIINTHNGEDLRMLKFFLVSPSVDCKSSLQCINNPIPCPGNILLAHKLDLSEDQSFDILVMENGVGYMKDSNPIYTNEYYQHELSLTPPVSIQHSLYILSHGKVIAFFTCLPTDRITCMKIATVTTNSSTKKTFVIIGLCSFTGLIDNDDCSGSILLFDITTLSPSDTDYPLKPYEIISTKAPVMQLDIMRTEGKEFLVVAKKSRFVYTSSASVSLFDFSDFKESDQFTLTNYVSCLVVVKNCILVGDINYGLSFLQYRKGKLNEICRDNEPSHPLHCSYIFTANNPTMYFSKFDENQNIEIYSIEDRRKLLKKIGDFHLPAPVSTVSPIDIPSIGMEQKNDVGNVIATTEGSIALIIPISGEQYMYLKSLQDDIIKNLPQYGALNNRNYRKYQPSGMLKYPRNNKLIDYSIIHRFVDSSVSVRNEVASRIKMNVNDILKTIGKVDEVIYKAL